MELINEDGFYMLKATLKKGDLVRLGIHKGTPVEIWLTADEIKSLSGAVLGSVTSLQKAKTSKENGKLGGRPRKVRDEDEIT